MGRSGEGEREGGMRDPNPSARGPCSGTAAPVRLTKQERDVARRAAQTIGLSVAGVDILRTSEGPKVLEVNSSPGLEGIETATGKDVASLIIQNLETKVRPLARDLKH